MKVLRCRDAGFDCDAVVKAEEEETVLQQAAAHAQVVHEVEITPAMAARIRQLINEDSE